MEEKTDAQLEEDIRVLVSNARIYNGSGMTNLAEQAMDLAERVHKIIMDRQHLRKHQSPYR